MNLTPAEKVIYDLIEKNGTAEDMFEFAYHCGRVDATKEQLHEMQKFTDGFAHPTDCAECNPLNHEKTT